MKYEICFVEFGVVFISEPVAERLADELLQKLQTKGIATAYKREAQ